MDFCLVQVVARIKWKEHGMFLVSTLNIGAYKIKNERIDKITIKAT